MTSFNEEHFPPDLGDVETRMRAGRREPSELELDELKIRAKRQAARSTARGRSPRSLVLAALLGLVVIGGGGSAVIAASDGGGAGSNNASRSQYCPPKSPGAGKPKNPPPGNACGHGPDTDNPGH